MPSSDKKAAYFARVGQLFDEYEKLFVVGADNVGSKQFQDIRKALRGTGLVLMGKNTLMRKAIRAKMADRPELEALLPFVKLNVGFVLTNGDFTEVREIVERFKVGAYARAGAIAPVAVTVPAGPTGQEPTKTSFFQALNIATKITKGSIEIINPVELFKVGEKVNASQAALLQLLDQKPFSYGLQILQVYDKGSVFAPAILDITNADLMVHFNTAVANVAAASLELGIPTKASIPHSISNGFKNLVALALECENFSFPKADAIAEILKDPSKFAAVAAPAATTAAAAETAAPVEEEEEEEEEEDMGFGLFD